MNAPGHPGSDEARLPAGTFDVVTLPGARGAALWRWWLVSAPQQEHAVPLEARCALAPPSDPSHDAESGITVIQLDAAEDRAAGIVIDLC